MPASARIRRRIGSARNIKQITRAMQFVAASKLRRAQESTLAARPYREKLDEVIADLAAVLDDADHPLLAERELDKAHNRLIVIMTSRPRPRRARSTRTRSASSPARSPSTRASSRSRRSAARAATPCAAPGSRSPPTSRASASDRRSPTCCRSPGSSPTTSSPATYDRVDVIYSRFVSTLVQRPVMEQLLPIVPDRGHRRHPGRPVPVRARSPRPSSRRSCRATSRPACTQPVLETKASDASPARWSR